MIIYEAPQGSPEWFQARAGVITASMFSTIRDVYKSGPDKGKWKSAALDYAFRLAIERISGEPLDEGYETWAMRRGHELEPTARGLHAMEIDRPITQIGFIATQDGKFGASVDGLIGEDGGAEYKCLVSPEKLRKTLVDGDLSDYMDQVQGGMWVTGRAYWHLCFYCPMLESIDKELFIHVVRRDDDYIEAMEGDLLAFEEVVTGYERKLKGDATDHTPEPPPLAA